MRESKVCICCGATFFRSPNPRRNWRERKYCSLECHRSRGSKATCVVCEKQLNESRRKYCSSECMVTNRGRLADILMLVDAGESPFQIANKLGVQVSSVGRYLDRHGRRDLAREFYRAGWMERAA